MSIIICNYRKNNKFKQQIDTLPLIFKGALAIINVNGVKNMNQKELHFSFALNSTLFISDRLGRFSGYVSCLLNEKAFPIEKEKKEKLSKVLGASTRKPYYILSNEGISELCGFAKDNDTLLHIYTGGKEDTLNLLRCAKALNMRTVLLSKHSLKEASHLADLYLEFENDGEAINLCKQLCDEFSNADAVELPPPIPFCGLSHCAFGKELNESAFAAYKENGISHMEISFGRYEDTISLDFKEYKRLADKYGITLWSYHLPFMPFSTINPAHFDETVRKFTEGYLIELMKEAKRDAGINIFVLHPSGEPIHEDDRESSFKQLSKTLNALCSFADRNGITVAVENLPRTCLGRSTLDMQRILGMHPSLKMCFDLNHIGGEDAEEVIKRLGSRIVTLHVSDYMGKDECHLMPGEGVIDWVGVIRSLKSVGYKGPFLYEISRGATEDGAIWAKEAWHTRLFIRENYLTHGDVKRNYDSLMNKAK